MSSETRKRFKNYITLQESLLAVQQESKVDEFVDDVVVVRLGDLVQELSRLSDINVEKIGVDIYTGIVCRGKYKYNMFDMLRLIEGSNDNVFESCKRILYVSILGGSQMSNDSLKNSFKFSQIEIPFTLEEIQADGKSMYEHMDVSFFQNPDSGDFYTTLIVNKKIRNIILNIPMKYLMKQDDYNWNPSGLFIQAVLNCGDKSYNTRNQYVRARARGN